MLLDACQGQASWDMRPPPCSFDEERNKHRPMFLAGVHAALGDNDEAFHLLDQAYANAPFSARAKCFPGSPVCACPRFEALAER